MRPSHWIPRDCVLDVCVCVSASQKAPSGREVCESVCGMWSGAGGGVSEKPAKEVTGD